MRKLQIFFTVIVLVPLGFLLLLAGLELIQLTGVMNLYSGAVLLFVALINIFRLDSTKPNEKSRKQPNIPDIT